MEVGCRKDSGFLICSSAIRTRFPRPARRPVRNPRRCALIILIAVTTAVISYSTDVARGAGVDYYQGRQLAEQLQVRRALNVDGAVLRELLDRLQTDYRICVVLDRRIDPSTRLSCRIPFVETAELLQRLAEKIPNCGVSVLDDLVYLGPRNHTAKLRTLIELQRRQVRKLRKEVTREQYALLTTPAAVGWDDVVAPRELIQQMLANAGLESPHADRVPHDLWHPKQLPNLNVVDAVTLLLFPFELSAEWIAETQRVQIVPLPVKIEVERRHSIPKSVRKTARALIERRYPELTARWMRSSVDIFGTMELHEEIESLLSGNSHHATSPGSSLKERTLTLRLQPGVTLRQIMKHLDESGISIRYAADLEPMLDTVVTAKLDNLPAEEFFGTLFAELPVEVRLTDDEVILQLRADP